MAQAQQVKMRQLVDWGAAAWAGLIAGAIYLVLTLILSGIFLDTPWVLLNMTAAMVLGAGSLLNGLTVLSVIVALIVHFAFSIIFADIIAYVIHRWGLFIGFIGGAALGLALYLINFYSFELIFPWFAAFQQSWIMAVGHVVFGAFAGGVYELLEEEEFVPITE